MSEYPETRSNVTVRTGETRRALLEQLAHVGEEVAALKRHVELIPPQVLEGRPLAGDPSFKEIYGLLSAYDRAVYDPAVLQLAERGRAEVEALDEKALLAQAKWNEMDMREIIDRVVSDRMSLVQHLAGLDVEAWHGRVRVDGESTDVFGLAYHVIQHDAELLRTAAYRLHESRLTNRDEDLPK